MVQNARAAMDMISGEVAVAKYNPAGAVFTGIPYNAAQLQVYADLNGNCPPAAACVPADTYENITFSYNSSAKRIVRNTNTGGGAQPLVENVQSFGFDYLDGLGNPIIDVANEANIRQIRLTITTRTSKPDPKYTKNSGYRWFTLTSVVTPRNLAF